MNKCGSDVIAPAGDITILAKTVDIVEARETSRYESEDKFKQSGLTVSVSSPLLSAMETGQQMADAASNTSDGRMQALAGAAAAFKGYNTYKGMTDAAGIAKIFDADKVQREINAQVQIMQAFTKEAPKAVGTYANEKYQEALKNGDQAEIDKWKEGGTVRVKQYSHIGQKEGHLQLILYLP